MCAVEEQVHISRWRDQGSRRWAENLHRPPCSGRESAARIAGDVQAECVGAGAVRSNVYGDRHAEGDRRDGFGRPLCSGRLGSPTVWLIPADPIHSPCPILARW